MPPEREEGKYFVLSGRAVIGSTFYRNVFLKINKRFVRRPFVNENYIKKSMYGRNEY